MLLAIAEYCDDTGHAYPGVSALAAKCRVSQRHAIRILSILRESGEIDISTNSGPKGTNRYCIRLPRPLTSTSPTTPDVDVTPDADVRVTPRPPTPDIQGTLPLTPMSPEPPKNRHEPSEEETHTARATSDAAERVCVALRRLEIPGFKPGNPDFLALIAAGATEAEFIFAAQEAIEKRKGFAYSLGILKNMRKESANGASAMPKGPMPINGHRQSAIDRQTETYYGLTGKGRNHESPNADDTTIIDINARTVG